MEDYAAYLKIVGEDRDLAKFVVSAVAKGLVKPDWIQYEFSMLQFKFYQYKSFNGAVSRNFYTDGVINFFNVCGAASVELMRGTNESMFDQSKGGRDTDSFVGNFVLPSTRTIQSISRKIQVNYGLVHEQLDLFVKHFKEVQTKFKNHVVFTSLQVDETDFGVAKKELLNGKKAN